MKIFFVIFILDRSFYSELFIAITSMMRRVMSKNIAAFSTSWENRDITRETILVLGVSKKSKTIPKNSIMVDTPKKMTELFM